MLKDKIKSQQQQATSDLDFSWHTRTRRLDFVFLVAALKHQGSANTNTVLLLSGHLFLLEVIKLWLAVIDSFPGAIKASDLLTEDTVWSNNPRSYRYVSGCFTSVFFILCVGILENTWTVASYITSHTLADFLFPVLNSETHSHPQLGLARLQPWNSPSLQLLLLCWLLPTVRHVFTNEEIHYLINF